MEEETFDVVPVKNNGPMIQEVKEVSCEACTKDCPLAGLVQGSAEWDAKMEVLVLAALLPML